MLLLGYLHFIRTISDDVTVTLTSITLNGGIKFGRALLGGFAMIITLVIFEVILSGEGLVLDLLNWEEEEVLVTLDFELKLLVL